MSADTHLDPIYWAHEAPTAPMSVDTAHLMMQRHRGCAADDCPRKREAWHVLVEAGHIKPDSSRQR
ncbi:hypothetical protein [Nocardia wallacei]|uniref:hypothetical protein n=1 Tax=Nocardia wallacei TaxID=480035 RepID=UPI00245610FF|nr:hypothetical protein [Nocardia wallacei]